MNRLTCHLTTNAEADLQALMEPVSGYISAVGPLTHQKVALIKAIIILVENVREINGAATANLETFSQNHIG